jgi:hypothetical protein
LAQFLFGRRPKRRAYIETVNEFDQPRKHQPDEEQFKVIHSEDVIWKPFPALPPAARLGVLVGEPTKPGPYLIRVKLPAGTKMLPHKHPEDPI